MFYLTKHSRHFIYGYMAADMRRRAVVNTTEETRYGHFDCSFRATAKELLKVYLDVFGFFKIYSKDIFVEEVLVVWLNYQSVGV